MGFVAFLRTSEFLNMETQSFSINIDNGQIMILLCHSKSGKRTGESEEVVITSMPLAIALTAHLSGSLPGDRLWNRSIQQFRKDFEYLLCHLLVGEDNFKPYSLRRGGATYVSHRRQSESCRPHM